MTKIDGKRVSKKLLLDLKNKISDLPEKPGLAFILVGNNTASETYVKMKEKTCQEIGIESTVVRLDTTVTKNHLLDIINTYNKDPTIDGILVQQPLPEHISTSSVVNAISSKKDVDGFHPENIGKLLIGDSSGFIPCTPLGIQRLMEAYKIDPEGKHVVILGRSNIVGKPLMALLSQNSPYANATVTLANSKTKNLKLLCQSADILIVAIGRAKFLTHEFIKKGAVVFDVGINKEPSSNSQNIYGDVDYENIKDHCSMITPVPGGVGPMTIAMLMENTYKSFLSR